MKRSRSSRLSRTLYAHHPVIASLLLMVAMETQALTLGPVQFKIFEASASAVGSTSISPNNAVIINEIHYHPDNNTEPVEFVELFNPALSSVDLTGWSMDGIDYVFPAGSNIPGRGYLVVAQDPNALAAKFGAASLGPFTGKLSNEGELLVLKDANGEIIDEVDYGCTFPWPIAANGEGASMELLHPSLDNNLAGSWRSSGYHESLRPDDAYGNPTPGRRNDAWTQWAPPQIRQVHHWPKQPLSNQEVKITTKITDPNQVDQVRLHYQVVLPGQYIPATLPIGINSLINDPSQSQPLNPDFEDSANWTTLEMVDDGMAPDEIAGDHIFTAVLPGQHHRTLMRYRIVARDTTGTAIQVPYADDASLNFAYYVYDGVPDYVTTEGSVAADGPGHVYSADVLTQIPVYTLITRDEDLYQCNGYRPADRIEQGTDSDRYQNAGRVYNWEGTLIYDGEVYDHIGYRLRGGNGRYNYGIYAGKRSMKFRFNRGNYFQARDIYGNKFPSRWQHLNTGKMFGNQIMSGYNRYPYGLNEIMDMRLFKAFNVPAPDIWWFHFRVVDGAEEAPTDGDGQYQGDFWGLYLAFENYDGAFLDRLGLPKGNLYKLSDKIYDGPRQLRYQGPDAVDDASDYENIRWNLNHTASADFIRDFLDCDEWYRYHTVTEAIRHYDIFSGDSCWHCLKNSAWYFYPDYSDNLLGQLQFLPFDVDDTWGPYFNMGVDHAKAAIYDQSFTGGLMQYTRDPEKVSLKQDYRNRIREFRDLQWQPAVINGMIDELAAHIKNFVPADRDRWRLDRTEGRTLDNGPLEDCVALMKQFAWESGHFQGGFPWIGSSQQLDQLANESGDLSSIPDTPTIQYIGSEGYPVNDLWFHCSSFSDPQGDENFAALSWRIAEYHLNYRGNSTISGNVLLEKNDSNWRYFKGTTEPSDPTDDWRQYTFNDSDWLIGKTPIGFGDNDDNTSLAGRGLTMPGHYYTVYLRHAFEVPEVNQIGSLRLHVYVDDGCIIWINGTEVTRLHCSYENKAYNSLTGAASHEATEYEDITLETPQSYLRNGTNVIAVHALQDSYSSDDFSIDVEITATPSSETIPPLAPSQYELQALWQSDEITDPCDRLIRIPAQSIQPHHTYRVRSRMKDDTGRWSHWSVPIEFVAGEATDTNLHQYLRMTELMYHPPQDTNDLYNNDDFEFIELSNTSTHQVLDLSTLSFCDGVSFSFSESSITQLAPGQCVLIVSHLEAFLYRYGQNLANCIAGVYSGSLNNSGERIEITDSQNGTLMVFTYSDNQNWPQKPDGGGDSLIPRSEFSSTELQNGILDLPSSWTSSSPTPGI